MTNVYVATREPIDWTKQPKEGAQRIDPFDVLAAQTKKFRASLAPNHLEMQSRIWDQHTRTKLIMDGVIVPKEFQTPEGRRQLMKLRQNSTFSILK
jgi:hypothetical protein